MLYDDSLPYYHYLYHYYTTTFSSTFCLMISKHLIHVHLRDT